VSFGKKKWVVAAQAEPNNIEHRFHQMTNGYAAQQIKLDLTPNAMCGFLPMATFCSCGQLLI
jgi:hypothetical protein